MVALGFKWTFRAGVCCDQRVCDIERIGLLLFEMIRCVIYRMCVALLLLERTGVGVVVALLSTLVFRDRSVPCTCVLCS